MESIKTVKRYHLVKDGSGWNLTINKDGKVWGSIHYNGTVHGVEHQEPSELFLELKMLLDAIPCCSIATEPERILVVGGSKKEDHIVSLNDSDQYVQDSPEESLWKSLELLAKRIIG